MIHEQFGSLGALLYLAFDVGMILLVLVRKREASAAIGWSLAIVLLPVLGALLFLLFGMTRMPRRLRRKMRHREAFNARQTVDARVPSGAAGAQVAQTPKPAHPRWGRLSAMLESLGEPAAVGGNRVQLLEAGEAAFERMFAAVAEAQDHVHLEMYIFRHDRLGRPLLDLLCERARAGVQVRLCVDYVGTLERWKLLRRLRKAGGQGAVFLPLFPFGKRFLPNLRNHRKILICDGRVAFFGGLNVGEEYVGRRKPGRGWCDLHVEVQGPAVGDVQRIFVEDWDFAAGELLTDGRYFPDPEIAPGGPVQILSGGPDRDVNPIREVFFHAFTQARKRLCIASPYVIPDAALRHALKAAARGGLEVDVITQSLPPDHYIADLAGSYYFDELLGAGIRIHRYMPGMMHGKLVIADGELAVLGSANLDNRSLQLNFELAGVFTAPADVRAMLERFESMLAECEELTLSAYEERGGLRRLGEGLARLVAPLL